MRDTARRLPCANQQRSSQDGSDGRRLPGCFYHNIRTRYVTHATTGYVTSEGRN